MQKHSSTEADTETSVGVSLEKLLIDISLNSMKFIILLLIIPAQSLKVRRYDANELGEV